MTTDTNNVVELRQYTLYGGKRDVLVDLFKREFVEPQNVLGARVLGTFHDLDDPDRFVWLRGFVSMDARAAALEAFYTGPVWRAHRDAANGTMLDSDNVLLLRPSGAPGAFDHDLSRPAALLTVTIYDLDATPRGDFADFFECVMRPHLIALGAAPFATLVSEPAHNNFPRLPVRTDGPVFAWFARWPNEGAAAAFAARLAASSGWRDDAPAAILPALMKKPELLRLVPT